MALGFEPAHDEAPKAHVVLDQKQLAMVSSHDGAGAGRQRSPDGVCAACTVPEAAHPPEKRIRTGVMVGGRER